MQRHRKTITKSVTEKDTIKMSPTRTTLSSLESWFAEEATPRQRLRKYRKPKQTIEKKRSRTKTDDCKRRANLQQQAEHKSLY